VAIVLLSPIVCEMLGMAPSFNGTGKLVSGSWDGTVRVWGFLDPPPPFLRLHLIAADARGAANFSIPNAPVVLRQSPLLPLTAKFVVLRRSHSISLHLLRRFAASRVPSVAHFQLQNSRASAGYVRRFHGSGLAEQVLLAKLGQREVVAAAARGGGRASGGVRRVAVFRRRNPQKGLLGFEITPEAVEAAVRAGEWVGAVSMALRLGGGLKWMRFFGG
jgi:hypothetical protein